ncbi:unnamed protein product [Didymodactylos carnosus]|uniref:Ankyrin repeat protein n=1 Tax=Didymodactylos carnosus TaxID=1234261 RepID=A0A815ZV60_9BILA|nr:unnamed protein product [Didymodactylos carnosus]CAF1590020.1 unnamed protein product [Didymodactylos carnosus]CAF4330758.1 unnamed protein product [Didymodactylos carnosus]CAF4461543.1 unnamed protein product [Didymodactylos carnosus]
MEETTIEQFARACCNNNIYLVELFLEQLTIQEINHKLEPDHVTALHYATYFGHQEIISLLLDHGASSTIRMKDGRTPLDLAETQEIQNLFKTKTDNRNFEQFMIMKNTKKNIHLRTYLFLCYNIAYFPQAVCKHKQL